MQLRPYQEKMEKDIYAAWSSGAKNVLAQLATGSGKTVIFTKILADYKGYTMTTAHRMQLVGQISLTLANRGIRHRIIAQKETIRNIISMHLLKFNRNFVSPQSQHAVASVDTLIKLNPNDEIFKKTGLLVQDEGHHTLRKNKWGKIAEMFSNAYGLYPTATPCRADGFGLGRHSDGVIDALVEGPSMYSLIQMGYLSKYRIIATENLVDVSEVPISSTGDFSPPKLRTAVHKSKITGSVIDHYLKFAAGKLGITFAVDVEAATEIALEFKKAGVPAEVISSKTPAFTRFKIMQQFEKREILQLVNVDLLGEGVDVPAIEVVSFARPSWSLGWVLQGIGRALRPMPGKEHAIIIDHVDNIKRHGLPDKYRTWSLDRRERRAKSAIEIVIPLRNCLNPVCLSVYERTHKACPHCGHTVQPQRRDSIEHVDGDLIEIDEATLTKMRGEITRIDGPAHPPQHLDTPAQLHIIKIHHQRQEAQRGLREQISLWAGHQKIQNKSDSEIYRLFYFIFGIDVMSAQALNSKDSESLKQKIIENL